GGDRGGDRAGLRPAPPAERDGADVTDTGTFADLLATAGVEEACALRGRLGFMAYHGGSLEEMTDVIAAAAAERCGASFYAVRQPADLNWHIPSHRVAPTDSSALAGFLDHVDVV